VETTTLLILYLSCKGFNTTTIWMVEQFGLAIILFAVLIASAFTSGTTKGIPGSMRHAEELSIT
jgi:hypothetical protein